MATLNNPFDSYQVFSYSGPSSAVRFPASVQVYHGGTLVGRISFYPDTTDVSPANGTTAPLGTPIPDVYFPFSRLSEIVTTLRQEKSLYLFLDTNTGVAMVATAQAEPIGG